MQAVQDSLIEKIRQVLSGPDRKLFLKIVDSFYERLEEEYDAEPFSPAELQAIEEAEEAIQRGDRSYFTPWEDVKKELGL
ncbi:hypothetical protein [Desulfobacca acetoxidans]